MTGRSIPIASAAAVMVLACSPVAAEYKLVYVMGVGKDTCGEYVRVTDEWKVSHERWTRDVLKYFAYRAWIDGLLTGASAYQSTYFAPKTDQAAAALWLYNWCKENPLLMTGVGATALVEELKNGPQEKL